MGLDGAEAADLHDATVPDMYGWDNDQHVLQTMCHEFGHQIQQVSSDFAS